MTRPLFTHNERFQFATIPVILNNHAYKFVDAGADDFRGLRQSSGFDYGGVHYIIDLYLSCQVMLK